MAKQTFTTGQVLTAAQMTSLQQTAMLGGAASAKVASYVLVAADAGDAITMDNAGATTITANTGLFATSDIVTIINIGTGACTITAGTATVTTSGSLVLAQNQGGVLRFTSPSAAIFLQFATPASGDIEGVTAGTGLSGGGTSGTVTLSFDYAVGNQAIENAQTGTTYTLALSDAGKMVTLTNASPITLTIPTNATIAFPTNTRIDILQYGAGQVTVGGAGVTINSSGSKLKLTGQYSGASLWKKATDTWVLIGDIAS
jgi:hypothetical protein